MADTDDQALKQEVEEASKYWNEAVAASEGKPVEETPEPEAKEHKPAAEPDSDGGDEAESEGGDEAPDDDAEEGTTDDEDAGEVEADPWDSVPEELRKAHEEAVKKAEKFEHEARSNRGRLVSLEKKHRELSQKLESETAPAKDQKKEPAVDPVDSIFDTPDWQKFAADFGADVAEPQKAAMRRLYEAMHSRIQKIEEQANALVRSKVDQQFADEFTKFNFDFHQWIGDIHEGYDEDADAEDPAYLRYVRDNFKELESFANSNKNYQKWWSDNYANLNDPESLMALFQVFEASRGNAKKSKSSAPKPNGADHKPEPQALTPKRKQQLKSAGTPPPRSAPGPGSRSKNDLPDPEDYANAFKFFEAKATR